MFRQEITKECFCCIYKKTLSYTEDFLCDFAGIVSPHYSCKKFSYDVFNNPYKKKRKIDSEKFSQEDFSL